MTIESDYLKIQVLEKGAELCSVLHKDHQIEYMWQAGSLWAKHSPILFPIVGTLKENSFIFKNKKYVLPRHGFARDMNFQLNRKTNSTMIFSLLSNENTLKVFPFHFELQIAYEITNSSLNISYKVINVGNDTMYFSIGGHPAFNVPIVNDGELEDYFLEFSSEENLQRHHLFNGLIDDKTESVALEQNKILALNKNLFEQDAIVLKNINSSSITLKSRKHNHGLTFNLNNCPYLGLWTAKDGGFICIEPWYGIADNIHHQQELEKKEGIVALNSGSEFNYKFSIDFF